MPATLKLKPLEAAMLAAARELDIQCLGGLWTLEGYQRELASPNSWLLSLTCHDNSCPQTTSHQFPRIQPPPVERLVGLGCLWSVLEEAHITILAVHPEYQGQGFGQALLHALLIVAQQQRLEWATLEVRVSNQVALSLYQKFGFQEVGRRRRYYPDTGEDGLVLWRSGLQHGEFPEVLHQWQRQIEERLFQKGWVLANTLKPAKNFSFYSI